MLKDAKPTFLGQTWIPAGFRCCIGFVWWCFDMEGLQAWLLWETTRSLLILTESMPVSSKTDLPLAKVYPISNHGSASGITELGRGEGGKLAATPHWSRGRVWGVLLRRKDQQTQCVMSWPWSSFPIHKHCSREESENLGVKLSLRRKEGWGEAVLKFRGFFSLSYSYWLVINKANSAKTSLFYLWW